MVRITTGADLGGGGVDALPPSGIRPPADSKVPPFCTILRYLYLATDPKNFLKAPLCQQLVFVFRILQTSQTLIHKHLDVLGQEILQKSCEKKAEKNCISLQDFLHDFLREFLQNLLSEISGAAGCLLRNRKRCGKKGTESVC